jgi:hypothetical protein
LLAMQMCSFSLHWVATPFLAHYYLESVRLLYRSNGMCEVKLGAVV